MFLCSIFYKYYEVHQLYSLTLIFFVQILFAQELPSHTVPILQSCLSLLIFKSMFKGVSQCIPAMSTLYFGSFSPFHYSSLHLFLPLPLFNSFQYTSLYPPPSQMLCFTILLVFCHSLFLSLFPEFHRMFPLLLTCRTYEFIYDHAYFCMCVYLLDLSFTYERKHASFFFPSLVYFT
jgi:hypothetical protein